MRAGGGALRRWSPMRRQKAAADGTLLAQLYGAPARLQQYVSTLGS